MPTIKEVETYKIVDNNHTEEHWVFYYYTGDTELAKFSVGKYVVKIVEGVEVPEGVETEAEAIEIMRLNIPELEA